MKYEIVNPDQSVFPFSVTHVICVFLFFVVDSRIDCALKIDVVDSHSLMIGVVNFVNKE